MRKLLIQISAKKFVRDMERGRFRRLLGSAERAQEWLAFMQREASIPHTDRVILRITVPHEKPYWVFAVYMIDASDPLEVHLEEIYGPRNEDYNLRVPEELNGYKFFEA